MMNGLSSLDIWIVGIYGVAILATALLVSGRPDGGSEVRSYFFADKQLPFWAVGTSIIAANISAEQIIGMSGAGYRLGLAIASYEWMAALSLILIAKYILPVFYRAGIETMPGFLESRYGSKVKTLMAVFWLIQYTFINLTGILWLGATAIQHISGLNPMIALVLLGVFSLSYQIYGGLKAAALTDVVQVTILVVGGLLVLVTALAAIGGAPTLAGVLHGLTRLYSEHPGHFHLIFSPDHPNYAEIPGMAVLFGGMWVMNISYFGFNQYIVQRALSARSMPAAQTGIAIAAYLKLLMPLIVVLPGICALILAPNLARGDLAYPSMMKLLPPGALGLVFAALVAAIVASSASKINSIATIFSLDLVRAGRPSLSERQLVTIGRWTACAALLTALVVAKPLLGNFDLVFQIGQNLTGFFAPPIVVIFLFGIFWKRCSTEGALYGLLSGVAASAFFFSVSYLHQHPGFLNRDWTLLTGMVPDIPFLNRVGWVFVISAVVTVMVSWLRPGYPEAWTPTISPGDFRTTRTFNLLAAGIVIVLVMIYAFLW